MPYRKTYKKKRVYRRKRPYTRRRTSMYSIAKKVMMQNQETKRFLPLQNIGDVTDGFVPSNDSRFDQRTLEWNLDIASGDTIGYIKPFNLADVSAVYNPVNQDGDHVISGKSINPKYFSLKVHMKNANATTADAYGPVRVVLLKLRDNTTTLPDFNNSPTESGKGGLYNRIDTDKYWVLKDTIYNLIPNASGIPREFSIKIFKKMSGTCTYNMPADGQIVNDTYPKGGIFAWFFFNRPYTTGVNAPIVVGTYTVGFKDS